MVFNTEFHSKSVRNHDTFDGRFAKKGINTRGAPAFPRLKSISVPRMRQTRPA